MVQKQLAAVTGARRAAKADARRGAILAAAAGAFRDRGVAATGMREIADAAGLSLGNLYYYFKNKDELVYFCQARALDRMLAAAADQDGAVTAAARLRHVVTAHLACTLEEVTGAAAHIEVAALPAALRRRIVARRDRYERAVRRIVKDGVVSGEFRAVDSVLVTRAILGALNWSVQWFRPEGALTAAAVAAAFADYLVQGLVS